ncbi:TORTIFOLIA1 protein [Trifolium repens]|nr:TORTIFOLIA1 protein [Trifolium repens]
MANLRRKSAPASRFSLPDGSSASNGKNVSALRKLNHKNWDVKVAMADQGDLQEMNENNTPLEMNRVLLNKNPDEKMKKHGGSKAGSRVVLYHEESQGSVPVKYQLVHVDACPLAKMNGNFKPFLMLIQVLSCDPFSNKCNIKSCLWVNPRIPEMIGMPELESLAKTYGKFWCTWQVDRGDMLPLGAAA